jgi:hypothetical protein
LTGIWQGLFEPPGAAARDVAGLQLAAGSIAAIWFLRDSKGVSFREFPPFKFALCSPLQEKRKEINQKQTFLKRWGHEVAAMDGSRMGYMVSFSLMF